MNKDANKIISNNKFNADGYPVIKEYSLGLSPSSDCQIVELILRNLGALD